MIDGEGTIHCGSRGQDRRWGRLFAWLDKKLPEGQRMRAENKEVER